MSPSLLLTVLVALGPAQEPGRANGVPDLAAAKALYASAAYEEALSRLTAMKDTAASEQIEQYRALCLLALGQTAEAERSLERMVTSKPLYQMTDADVSPRLVSMFHEVRQRLLPAAARDLYTAGKAHFDQKRPAEAAAMFKDVLAIMADQDFRQGREMGDLKLLAEGFLKLAEAEAAKPKEPPPAKVEVARPPPPVPPPPAIYSADDKDVVQPVEIDRKMPPWNPPNAVIAATATRGVLEVVIDERGNVESVALRAPVSRYYDSALIEAARKWRYKPALRHGQPVKFRKHYTISLRSSQD